eukprot:scaffold1237_cov403-Prasinococcus_capsulatus_cf.AAC.16
MAPKPAGMQWNRIREEPHLRRQGIHSLPFIDTQNSQPELAPGCDHRGISMIEDPYLCFLADLLALALQTAAQDAKRHIVQSCSKHRRLALDMQTPASILILVVAQASSNIAGNHHSWHQEHRTAVVSRKVAVRRLQFRIEGDALRQGVLKAGFLAAIRWSLWQTAAGLYVLALHPQQLIAAVFLFQSSLGEGLEAGTCTV